MYVLAIGNTRIDYDFQEAIDRATGGAVNLIKSKPERMVSEELGLKEIRNFSQDMLRQDSVYLIDYESEAFVWVGKKVPKDVLTDSFSLALSAMENIHCCGKERIKRVTLSMVNYAYEPQIFKTAFKSGWIDFSRPDQAHGGTIQEESSESDQDEPKINTGEHDLSKIIDSKTLNEAVIKLPNHCWLN